MRIGIVGEVLGNRLSPKTYEAIFKAKNLELENDSLKIELILLDSLGIDLTSLPCDEIFLYSNITGNDINKKIVSAIEHYFINSTSSLIIVALSKDVDSIIPESVVKINSASINRKATGFLQCENIMIDKYSDDIIVVKPVYSGNASAHYCVKDSAIISFEQNTKSDLSLNAGAPKLNLVEFKCECNNNYIQKIEVEQIKSEGLLEADFVVVCGKGVGSKEATEEIAIWAKSVGAAVGGTKKVIDHGWLEIQQLIGQTGQKISPKICLVIGVSGATPFINGIIKSEKIIAVNNDKNARIFDYADIGIVEDYKVVIKGLKEESFVLEALDENY